MAGQRRATGRPGDTGHGGRRNMARAACVLLLRERESAFSPSQDPFRPQTGGKSRGSLTPQGAGVLDPGRTEASELSAQQVAGAVEGAVPEVVAPLPLPRLH